MSLDREELDKIIEWFNKGNLTSATVEYNAKGEYKITLAREKEAMANNMGQLSHPMNPQYVHIHGANDLQSSSSTLPNNGEATTAGEASKESSTSSVVSPIVGTFYRSPGPDTPPFVQVGDKVKKGDVLCIIEAMKVMNELEAEFDMEIVSIATDNQQLVEFGQSLFEVKVL